MCAKKRAIIYGRNAVIEALHAEQQLTKLAVRRDIKSDKIREMLGLAHEQNIPVQRIPNEAFPSFIRKNRIDHTINHQGVIGFVSPVQYFLLDDLLAQAYEKGETPLFLLLDKVTDVRNLGAMARTAYCMGVHGLVIPSNNAAQITDDSIHASAGALNHLPVVRARNIAAAIDELKLNGIQVMASALGEGQKLPDLDLTVPVAMVVGAEDTGISKETAGLADSCFEIPMSGAFDSLNVSVSAGMMLYEVVRQRTAK